MNFRVGDKVKLKTGGPAMTVSLLSESKAHCVWFDANDVLHERAFYLSTLRGPAGSHADIFRYFKEGCQT